MAQYALVDLAYRRAQGRDSRRSVEVEDAQKILMLKVIFRLQAATGHEGIGDAHGGGVPKRDADVEIIIFLHEGIFNDVEYVALVCVPVFVGKLGGDALKLVGKAVHAGNLIIALQHGGHAVGMLLMQLPQIDKA
ncbi:MAG TPA: hypothetical protein P5519_00420 [Spirochaetia bacterium]|nr:hypothetical protein [Spirochaetia bacterium]